ncbi:helicase-associated domain-containing protein [Streptomyces sp. H10-C2]|uniref:helicase-associated domain-containing protein n=1 Tax=unclassified Streptomyces TaxID=2593676 RepID=UPI0024BB1AB4|nr:MULTISPECIES: helicase-associated domain-containing protein [unclassified Streptomyces]MDJ0347613.1 helicase-associated domain-containing protein [Streptomyces sp. PH10-H1]MDJ0375798.1 helicase-associated domain-containing protein [Streptomyces sp. H10-C2]
MTGSAPRTLAEDLRARGDDALAALLRARPDLLSPVPNDLTQLATRAATRASVVRALERLDRFTLQTTEALAVMPDGGPYAVLRALMTGDAADKATDAALPRAVECLREQGLVWGGDDRLRLVRTARDLLAPSASVPSPTGLGPSVAEATSGMSPARLQEILADVGLPATHDPMSAVAALADLFRDRKRMKKLLGGAPEGATGALGKLAWGPPYGEVADAIAPVRAATATTPVQWLLARGLLLPAGQHNVVLPREAALHLRAGRAHRVVEPAAPALTPVEHSPQAVDGTAAGQAFSAVQTVEELLKAWETGGPPVMRAGGVSVRDLKRVATALDVSEALAAFWLELAYAAGLLASDGELDEAYAPTPASDDWLRLPAQERWTVLATAWLAATRTPGLVGTRDAKGRALSALGPDLDRSLAPEVRRRVLGLLATLPEGASAAPAELLDRLRWDRPLRGGAGTDALRAELLRWTVTEAELLGLTGRGALAGHARSLLGPAPAVPRRRNASGTAGTPTTAGTSTTTTTSAAPASVPAGVTTPAEAAAAAASAANRLAPLLPQPLDHVLLQADLTAVAPGPLEAPLAEMIGVLADIESKGGATVYRFTPESVRRALDAGRTAADLHTFLAERSRTPVPQPLSYLIDDVARKHGRLRVGVAAAYLRCDDDTLLSELLADRRAHGLGLRRLAPTVLAAQTAPDTLLERLRAMGFAPAAESADGDVVITRADAVRTPRRAAPTPVTDGPPAPNGTLLGAAVKAIRAGDHASTAVHRESVPAHTGNGGLPRTAAAETLATMQAAVLTGDSLWIGYVNADGAASQRVIGPVRVEGGFVTAYDHTADEVRTFALHRITGVSELADDPA